MPSKVTEALANKLDAISKICVKDAVDGERIRQDAVYIARTVYSIPRKPVEDGIVDAIVPPDSIVEEICRTIK
jgi:hypothetical protein